MTEKAMWPFYKVCLRNEGFGDERDDTNTCMLHVHPPGPPSGTVTCILEVLSLSVATLSLSRTISI